LYASVILEEKIGMATQVYGLFPECTSRKNFTLISNCDNFLNAGSRSTESSAKADFLMRRTLNLSV
jgi:hypothetical protein